MGCRCKKPNRPTGFGVKEKTKAPESPSPASPPPNTAQSFTLVDRSGRTQTFGSKLERDAAQRRLGL